MKLYLIVAAGFLMALFFLRPSPISARELIPGAEAVNRARHAQVSASGFRLARMEEVPRSQGLIANLTLLLPQLRPRWQPKYAVDGSPLTFWASPETEGLSWLEFGLANALRPRVKVKELQISWGRDYPVRWRILVSPDGTYWRPVHYEEQGRGGVVSIQLETTPIKSIRLELHGQKAKSVSVVEAGIFGDPEAEEPPAGIENLRAAAEGPDRVKLAWEQAADEVSYLYAVYRREGKEPGRDRNRLVGLTAVREFTDYGLKPGRAYTYVVVAEGFSGKSGPPSRPVTARTTVGPEFYRFPRRGIVEGFYNDPWPHQERLRMMRFLEDAGFNYYLYAPKVEPYHRQWWREPYPEAELANFAELVEAARAHGVTFNYGISPGLDFNFRDPRELELLQKKLASLFAVGVRSFTLCFDDIPGRAGRGMARRQVNAVNQVHAFLKGLDPESELFFVPTVYSRTYAHWDQRRSGKADYLEELAGLEPEIGIFWTGPGEVFSPHIEPSGARGLSELWGRKLLIWDNYPVNDVGFRFNIFTGPYLGRPLELDESVDGIFLNPMFLPNASKLALFTAGLYMTREEYDPWSAYEESLKFLGRSEAGYQALKTISDCLLPHPVFPGLGLEQVPVHRAIQHYWEARSSGSGLVEAEAALRGFFDLFAENPAQLSRHLAGTGLAYDLLPASEKLSLYGRAGLKCLEFINEQRPERRVSLRQQILELQARSRLIPWRLADERTARSYALVGARLGRRSSLDDFITRTLAEFR